MPDFQSQHFGFAVELYDRGFILRIVYFASQHMAIGKTLVTRFTSLSCPFERSVSLIARTFSNVIELFMVQ